MSRRPQRSYNLPSTPNRKSVQSQPSTTPLVPPPSYLTNKSTTPAGPPPRSVLGSSYNPSNVTFPRNHGSGLRSYTIPDSSPPRSHDEDEEDSEDGEEELPNEPDMQLDAAGVDDTALELFGRNSTLMSSIGASTRSLKRSRNGRLCPDKQSDLPAIARAYGSKRHNTKLPKSDAVVLEGERAIHGLSSGSARISSEEQEDLFARTAARLTSSWRDACTTETREGGVGPEGGDDAASAAYIASFILQLHHPHAVVDNSNRIQTSGGQMIRRGALSTPMPRALLDWINTYHNPFPDDFESILMTQPAPSANESFWDVVFASVLRGRIDRAIILLRRAAWEHAITALDDEASQPGYTGHRLQNTQACVEQCINVLSSCPADWDVRDNEWSVFRQRIRTAWNELQAFAGEDGEDEEAESDNIFSRSAQGSFNFSRASRKAGSRVPWSIFENLKLLYSQLLGQTSEILMTSQDWLEASIFLTVWWDGEDDFDAGASLLRSALRKESRRPREVDITPLRAYRRRLGDAFILATSEPDETGFSIDTTDAAHLGIACAMEDDVAGVLCILQSLSLPIAATVADIANYAGWLPNARMRSKELLNQGFDSEDLLVLSHGPNGAGAGAKSSSASDREEILLRYADLLLKKDQFKDEATTAVREGWQIASAVYGRLSDHGLADQKTAELLDGLKIDSIARADKVLQLCSELGLTDQARRVAERFADSLSASSQDYGAILTFYARAHAYDKLDNTLTLLTSFCLVQSTAMPPQAAIDEQLASILGDRAALRSLMHIDREAATYLASRLSGYATARNFYELRDHELLRNYNSNSSKPVKRKRDAAKALLSLIMSAADCIRGGLFDPEVQSVVPIDGILVLLGEVIPLCHLSTRVFTSRDIFALLQIIEDFSASPARIREAAEDVLGACREASSSRSGGPPSLQKSKSDVSTHSGLSESSYELLMASSTMLSQGSQKQPSLVIERAWDWRKGLAGLHSNVNAQSLLLLLRTVLANELGKVWIETPE